MTHYRFVDYLTQGYVALVGGLLLLLHGDAVPDWGWLLAAHVLCLGCVHWLIQAAAARPANRFLGFLRHFYPLLLYTGFYRESGALNQMVVSGYLDPVFYQWDLQLFGFAPCFRFMEALPSRFAGEVFYGAYFSYYLMIAGIGLALYARNRSHFCHYVSVVSFVLYVCYLIYIFLPVVGPRIYYSDLGSSHLPPAALPPVVPEFPAAVRAGFWYRVMAAIYHGLEAPGAAFPSSHVAVAWVTVYFSFRYLRSIRWVHFGLSVLLSLATVYCRYHFAVDVLAGLLTAALLLPLAHFLHRRFSPAS